MFSLIKIANVDNVAFDLCLLGTMNYSKRSTSSDVCEMSPLDGQDIVM